MSAPNWLGLLKWTLANADGTTSSSAKPMSDEDKAFLERVMKEAVKDEPARMQEIMAGFMKILDDGTANQNEEKIEEELDELRDMIDQIDMAQIFVKFGGLECLLRLVELSDISLGIRCSAASVIGALSQNNLTVQDEMYKKGTVDRLAAVCSSVGAVKLQAKVLFAMSCLVRNHAAAEVYFTLTYASGIFSTGMDSNDAGLVTRSLFLASALISSDYATPESQAHIVPCFVPTSFRYLASDEVDIREGALNLLINIAQSIAGKVLMSSPQNKALLEEALAALTAIPRELDSLKEAGTCSSDPEQSAYERELVEKFRVALISPLPAKASTAKIVEEEEGVTKEAGVLGEIAGNDTDAAAAAPVLLLEPAALSAASSAP